LRQDTERLSRESASRGAAGLSEWVAALYNS